MFHGFNSMMTRPTRIRVEAACFDRKPPATRGWAARQIGSWKWWANASRAEATFLPKKCPQVPKSHQGVQARYYRAGWEPRVCPCKSIHVLPAWNNRSFSRSQAQPTDAIGLDQRCSAQRVGGLQGRAGPRPSRPSGCLTGRPGGNCLSFTSHRDQICI